MIRSDKCSVEQIQDVRLSIKYRQIRHGNSKDGGRIQIPVAQGDKVTLEDHGLVTVDVLQAEQHRHVCRINARFIGEGFHKRIDLRKNTVLFRRVLLKKSGDWRNGVETARRQRDWSRPACNEDKWLHEADECDGAQQKTGPPAGG